VANLNISRFLQFTIDQKYSFTKYRFPFFKKSPFREIQGNMQDRSKLTELDFLSFFTKKRLKTRPIPKATLANGMALETCVAIGQIQMAIKWTQDTPPPKKKMYETVQFESTCFL